MEQSRERICIVGAGGGGLTAAYFLKKRGYTDVVVYERSDRVGGKCMSFEYERHGYDMGFHEMGGGYYDVTQLAREVGVATGGRQRMLIYDAIGKQTLTFKQAIAADGYSMVQMLAASLRYVRLLFTRYRRFQVPGSGLARMPADLALPLVTWMHRHRLEAMRYVFSYILRNQAYGRIDQLAAAYWVKFQGLATYLTVSMGGLGISSHWPRIFPGGSQKFWEAVAKHVRVRLRSPVEAVRRRMVDGRLVVEVDCKGETEKYDHIIIATEVDPESLAYLDLDDEERSLFSKIRYNDIWATAARVEGLPHGIVSTVPVPAVGGYSGYIKDEAGIDMAVFYSLTDDSHGPEQINARIVEQVESMPRHQGLRPKVEMPPHRQHHWRGYFPHVPPTDVADGFYDRLESLQGQRHTSYASGAFSFELLGDVVAYSKRLVYEQFPEAGITPIPFGIISCGFVAVGLMAYMINHFARLALAG
jgi:predicted NAD/FAD-dependent oxidoreductase